MSKRQPEEWRATHNAADFYEPRLRAKFVKAMKQVQKKTSINALAMSMGNHKQAISHVKGDAIEQALEPLKQVIIDAFMHGGKIGAVRVQKLGKV